MREELPKEEGKTDEFGQGREDVFEKFEEFVTFVKHPRKF